MDASPQESMPALSMQPTQQVAPRMLLPGSTGLGTGAVVLSCIRPRCMGEVVVSWDGPQDDESFLQSAAFSLSLLMTWWLSG